VSVASQMIAWVHLQAMAPSKLDVAPIHRLGSRRRKPGNSRLSGQGALHHPATVASSSLLRTGRSLLAMLRTHEDRGHRSLNLAYLFALSQFFFAWFMWRYMRAGRPIDAMARKHPHKTAGRKKTRRRS